MRLIKSAPGPRRGTRDPWEEVQRVMFRPPSPVRTRTTCWPWSRLRHPVVARGLRPRVRRRLHGSPAEDLDQARALGRRCKVGFGAQPEAEGLGAKGRGRSGLAKEDFCSGHPVATVASLAGARFAKPNGDDKGKPDFPTVRRPDDRDQR